MAPWESRRGAKPNCSSKAVLPVESPLPQAGGSGEALLKGLSPVPNHRQTDLWRDLAQGPLRVYGTPAAGRPQNSTPGLEDLVESKGGQQANSAKVSVNRSVQGSANSTTRGSTGTSASEAPPQRARQCSSEEAEGVHRARAERDDDHRKLLGQNVELQASAPEATSEAIAS